MENRQTPWNKKLVKFAGKFITCDQFEKNGLKSEGYIINENGSLGFRNDLKSIDNSSSLWIGEFKNYWPPVEKSEFLKAAIIG